MSFQEINNKGCVPGNFIFKLDLDDESKRMAQPLRC